LPAKLVRRIWSGWKTLPATRQRALIVLTLATLLLTLDFYHSFTSAKEWDDLILFLFVPLAILLALGEDPRRFGLRLGNWRLGLVVSLVGCALMLAAAIGFAAVPEMRAYYAQFRASLSFWPWLGAVGAQMFAWEFFFRGFILFGLLDEFGWWAVPLQAGLFMVAHWGKPEIEAYSSLLGGLLLGWAILRVRGFWPAWIIHWFLNGAFEAGARWGIGS
jgi:uncharacterized protein